MYDVKCRPDQAASPRDLSAIAKAICDLQEGIGEIKKLAQTTREKFSSVCRPALAQATTGCKEGACEGQQSPVAATIAQSASNIADIADILRDIISLADC